jgi:CRP-like cAMP-binding protein
MAKRGSPVLPSANRRSPRARKEWPAARTTPVSNQLLAAIHPDDYARLAPTLEGVSFPVKRWLHKPDEAITEVYFPCDGFCSVLTVLEDGAMVEVVTIGCEGMVGLSALFEGGPSPSLAMVQADMETCYQMPISAFRREMERRGSFYDVVTSYARALVGIIMQGTACNAIHSLEQRLARWFLTAHDRVASDSFPLTHEFIAMMLGAARPTVTVVAGTLQKAGLIRYRRGIVTIVDREKLEAASCECYGAAISLLAGVVRPRDGMDARRARAGRGCSPLAIAPTMKKGSVRAAPSRLLSSVARRSP